MKRICIAIALMFSLLSTSCKKEEVQTLPSQIVNRSWKSTGFKLAGVEQSGWCWKNSIFNFYEDGTVFITEGDNEGACFGNVIGRIKKYKYTISSDEKWLVTHYQPNMPSEVDSFLILTVSSNKLSLKRTVNKTLMPPGESWEDEYTLMP